MEAFLSSSYAEEQLPVHNVRVIAVVFHIVDMQTENTAPLFNLPNDLDFTDRAATAQRNYVAYLRSLALGEYISPASLPASSERPSPPSLVCTLETSYLN